MLDHERAGTSTSLPAWVDPDTAHFEFSVVEDGKGPYTSIVVDKEDTLAMLESTALFIPGGQRFSVTGYNLYKFMSNYMVPDTRVTTAWLLVSCV